MHKVTVREFLIGDDEALAIASGPCVIESEDHCLLCARMLREIFTHHWMNFIFKASYDKANRSSIDSFRGPGMEEGLRILEKIRDEFNVPVLTDVHTPEEARAAAEVVDILQIPAFLSRQTDLLVAAGRTGKPVEIKKGQFMAPWDMAQAVKKVESTGNTNIIVADRGTSFGYNNLVSDFRSIPIMKQTGYPVMYDVTHSLQLPGGEGKKSGGTREYAAMMARLGLVAGANMLLIEAHPEPQRAKSDAATVMAISDLPQVLSELDQLYSLMSNW